MLLTQEVVDRLHWVECGGGHFDKCRVPVTHGPVPQTGQLKGLDFDTACGLVADEPCFGVNVVLEVESVALVVVQIADEVDWCRLA